MLTMPEINSIKCLRNDKSLSVNAIAKIHNINWRTAKKYADNEQLPKENLKKKKGMMYEEKWGEIVSDWLLEDLKLKKKSRRTNKKLFTGLNEMGFPGSYRTVCNFIQEWREGRSLPEGEEQDKNYERLSHPPSEAQLDFGLMEAVFTDEFLRFANFYGFQPQACNAYSGNEKGNVENKVGYIRYNFINPAPTINNLEHLTCLLAKQLAEDRSRTHYEKGSTINEPLEEEHQFLWNLPDEEYPIFKEEKVKANKYGEIILDKTKIYIPMGYNYTQLTVIKYWDRYKAISPQGEVLHEDYRPYMNRSTKIPWESILKSWITKPRVVDYSRYAAYLPGRITEYIKVTNYDIRKDRIKWLVSLLSTFEMSEINEQFYELVNTQSLLLQEPENHPYDVNWAKYDQLQKSASRVGEAR